MTLTFGRHKGKTLKETRIRFPNYTRWIMVTSATQECDPRISLFAEYLLDWTQAVMEFEGIGVDLPNFHRHPETSPVAQDMAQRVSAANRNPWPPPTAAQKGPRPWETAPRPWPAPPPQSQSSSSTGSSWIMASPLVDSDSAPSLSDLVSESLVGAPAAGYGPAKGRTKFARDLELDSEMADRPQPPTETDMDFANMSRAQILQFTEKLNEWNESR